jgi:hypothetical protein
MNTTTAPTLDELRAASSPLARRMFTVQDHLAMVLGLDWAGPRYIAEQRQHLDQMIAELQAAQAELDPPVAGTD